MASDQKTDMAQSLSKKKPDYVNQQGISQLLVIRSKRNTRLTQNP